MTRTDSGAAGTTGPDDPPGDDTAGQEHDTAEAEQEQPDYRPAPVRLRDITGLPADEYQPL